MKSVVNALIVSNKLVSSKTRLNSETKTSYSFTTTKNVIFFQNAAFSCKLGYALFKCLRFIFVFEDHFLKVNFKEKLFG